MVADPWHGRYQSTSRDPETKARVEALLLEAARVVTTPDFRNLMDGAFAAEFLRDQMPRMQRAFAVVVATRMKQSYSRQAQDAEEEQ